MVRDPGGNPESSWSIVGRTLSGESLAIGPFEKRYAEQLLADIRNRVSNDSSGTLESEGIAIPYTDIDLPTLGMELVP